MVKEDKKIEEQVIVEMSEDEASKKNLEEMSKVIDEKEEKADAEVSRLAAEQFKKEESKNKPYERESREARFAREDKEKLDSWIPKTELGKEVRAGKITDIDTVFTQGRKILESEIVDILLPTLQSDLLFIGQSKGKFGGGKRRAFRQTQKISKEGSTLTFGVMAVVGDGNGHIGIGYGRAGETLPAKEKAIRKAKLNLVRIPRGCASYDCSCTEEHSIPITTEGKCSSARVKLMPAPQGTGLVCSDELKRIMKAVGIKDIYSRCEGRVRTTFNTAKACMEALNKLNDVEY